MKTMEERILQQIEENRKVQAISFVALAETGYIDSDTVSDHKDMFEKWGSGVAYKTGHIRNYNGVLYKVVQDHTSHDDWMPPETPSLYEPIGLTSDGYPVWSRPSGAHDAYNTGDIVDYNGTLYKSLIDGNVYSPDEYAAGWEVVK